MPVQGAQAAGSTFRLYDGLRVSIHKRLRPDTLDCARSMVSFLLTEGEGDICHSPGCLSETGRCQRDKAGLSSNTKFCWNLDIYRPGKPACGMRYNLACLLPVLVKRALSRSMNEGSQGIKPQVVLILPICDGVASRCRLPERSTEATAMIGLGRSQRQLHLLTGSVSSLVR